MNNHLPITMATIFTDTFAGSGLVSTAAFENVSPVSGNPGNEIVFLMGNLPDLQALIGGIKPGVEVHILDPQGDGIAQMDSILNGRSGIDAIHIFSHGASGSLALGTTTLNSNTLLDHQAQLAELGSHLTSTGDLLLYGCNVAQSADGQAFIESIARTTGADVAASTDLTGAASLGGDWVLEAQTGAVEEQNLSIDSFASVLDVAGAATIQQGTDISLIRYDLHNWFNASAFAFQINLVPIISPYTGSTGADIVFQCKALEGTGTLKVGDWYTWTELQALSPSPFPSGQATDNGPIDANSSQGYMDFAIAARIDWNNPSLPSMLEFTLGGSRTYQLAISKAAPPNTAPSAGSGSYTVYEGQSATITLSTSTTSASDPERDALSFNPSSVSYTAPTNAALKGTYNNVSSTSYSVSDGKLSGTGGVFSWNVTYTDDPTTWGTPPSNQTWSSSGISSFSYGTGASDPEGDAITYSYVSSKQTWMSISGTTISGNVAPEYAGQTYTITVSATSSGTPSPIQKTLTITTGTAAQLNDLPTAAANSLALTAVGTRVFTAANFGFTDLDNTVGLSTATGAALDHITITALPATGTLKLSGTAVIVNQQIAAANIANLTYTSGTTFDKNDTFTFTVNDGIADSTSSYTVTLTDTLGATGQAPVIKLPSVTSSTLLVPYTDASYLNPAKAPAPADYVVTVNGTAVTVSSVAIASNSRLVTLTLAVPVAVTDHITISYTKPASNAVQDSSGNEAAGFSTRDVVNGTVTINPVTGATVITTQSSFDTSIPAPTGNVDVVNTGTGTVIVNALDPNGTVVTSGTGATTVKNPTGSVNTTNTGTGTTTVDGAGANSVVTATGTGVTDVSNPANNVQVINNSTGSTLITGVSNGNTVIPKGSGEVVVNSVLTTPGIITVDATNKQSNLTADNDSTGTINITGLANGASLKSTGSGNSNGATNVVTPVGNLTLDNSGTSPVNITGFDTDKTLTVTGSGSTNVTSPDGNITVANNGTGTATISGALNGKTVTPEGIGPVVVTSALGAGSSITVAAAGNQSNVTADNDGAGVIIITGLTDGATLKSTGSGNGATNVVTPIGSLSLDNTGTSPVNITGIDTGKTLTITGSGATNIVTPDGNVTVNNTGTGTATVSGTTNSSTITTQGTGPITVNSVLTGTDGIIVNAAANQHITLDNDSTGTITVSGVTTGSTIYNIGSGSGTTNINNPTGTGTLTVQNTGADPLTVTGLDSGATLTNTLGSNGNGGIILASPDGNATINNLGSNTVTTTGVANNATISTVGTGTTTITDPTGSLTVNNTGSGTVSVGGLNDGAAITTNGTQPITISSPDGSLAVHNTGAGIDTITSLLNNKTVTTDGTGTTNVSDPSGDVTLHNTSTGSLTVTGANNGCIVTTTGTTSTTVKNPDGNVTVNNTGTGTTTVEGTLTAKTVTIGGTGPIVVNSVLLSPGIITVDATLNQQHLTVDNDGTGAINITGLTNGASLKSTGDGTGTTTVVTPIGDLALESTGTNVVVITGFDTGSKLSVTGTANTTVKNPDGDVTVKNDGTGIVTVEGVPDGKTVTASGPGTTLVSDPLGDITLHNDILTSVVSVSGVNTGKTVTSTGVGPKAVNAPDGDITINSTGTGVTTVSGTLNGSTVTTKGTGPITIHSDLTTGNTINVNAAANTLITLDNDNTGAINVTGVTTGSTIQSTGTGGTGGTGTTTITNPTGNLIVDNTGTSPVKIIGFDTNKTLTVTGNATSSTEVVDPDGNVFVSNNGTGRLTVSGLNNGNSVTNAGTGPVTITHPDGNVNAINNGTGLISVNNVHTGSTVNCTGNGPQTIDLSSLTATQSVTVDNDGTGAVNVVNIPSGVGVTFTGDGPTTVSSLTGNVALENLSSSLVTIANADNGSIITTTGDGPFFMDADVPVSQSITVDITNNANITFDNDGPGVVNVIGSNNNTITTTGNGPMTVTNPLGNLVVDNSGSGVVTVNGAANNAVITPQHEGPVVVNSLLAAGNSITVDATGNQSHLTVDNDGTGIIKVTNLADGASLKSIGSGSGATDVVTPVGNLTLDNTGTSPVNITGFDTDKTLTITGGGSTNVNNPDGNLTVLNNGGGTATVTGALNGTTVTPQGSGPVIVSSDLVVGSSITVDAKDNQSHVTADNDGAGVINVTGLTDGATLKSTGSGSGATNVVTPVGNLTLDNTGLSPVNITGFDNSKTLAVTGSGPTTVSSPDGNMTVANNGSGLVTLTGVLENTTISATGSGNTAISTPSGDIAVANSGTGLVTLIGIPDGKIVTTSGTGPATIDNPAGNVTVANSGTGPVKVNGANDNSTVTTTGDKPVTISSPDGNLIVHNIGTGVDTVTGLVSGKTVTTDGSGETIVSDPSGDVTLHNSGTGALSVTGANNGSTVTTTGSTATTVSNSDGNVTVKNTGTGTTTVDGTHNGSTVTVDGSGPIIVHSILPTNEGISVNATLNQNNLTVDNDGTGAINITGLTNGASLKSTGIGTGATTVSNPVGSISLDNTGTNIVTITGFDNDKALTVTGSGSTTVSSPDGNASIINNGTGLVTLTGVAIGKTISTSGSGLTNVSDPLGNITLDNASLTGTVAASGVNTGCTVTTTGVGSKEVNTPDGNVTINSTGVGKTTVSGTLSGSTVTTQGTGPITVHSDLTTGTVNVNAALNRNLTLDNDNGGAINVTGVTTGSTIHNTGIGTGYVTITTPVGNLTVDNTGTDPVKITGFDTNKTLTLTGSATSSTEVVDPDGNVVVANSSSAALIISGLNTGNSVTNKAGSGTVNITNPDGNVYATNDGTGAITISGLTDGSTINSKGSGPQTVDLENLGSGHSVTIDNDGSGVVDLLHVSTGTTVSFTGNTLASGATTIRSLSGEVTLENVSVSSSVISVYGIANGSKIHTTGTGEIAITTALSAGEKISIDPTGNDHLRITNTGAGQVDVLGSIALDSNDAMAFTLTGNNTTIVNETGTLDLGSAPLTLSLAAGYTPQAGDTITLISNDGNDAVTGIFAGKPEGSVVTVGGYQFTISYKGGIGGNDVVLGMSRPPLVDTTDVTGAVAEQGTPSGNITDSGTIGFTDGDLADTHSISAVTPSSGALGTLTASVTTDSATAGVITWNYSVAASAVEYLAASELKVESFTFNVQDSQGSTVSRTVEVTITGTNDAPTLVAVTSGSIAEVTLSASTTEANLSGSLVGADVDNNTILNYGISGGTVADGLSTQHLTYGTLTVDTATGAYSYVKDAAATEALHVGESVSDLFTVTVTDDHSVQTTRSYTVNLTGANDAPTLVAVTSGSIAEDALASTTTNASLSGTLAGADVDNDKVLTYGITGGTIVGNSSTLHLTYGTLTLDTAAGAYSYARDAAAVEALHVGESASDVFTVTVTDNHNAQTTQSYTVNLTGANDAPTLVAVTSGTIAEVTLSANTTEANLSGTLVGADVDNDKLLTYGILTGSVTAGVSTLAGSYGTLTVDTATGAYSYEKDAAAAEVLHVGESVIDLFTVTVTDNHGVQATQNYTINVTGANDAPTLGSVTNGSIAEDALASTTTNANLSGTLAGADVDNDKVLTYGILTGSVTAGVSTLAGSYGTLTVDTITGAYSYAQNTAAAEALHVGESVNDLFTVTVTDNHGMQATQNYTINVAGANDAPTLGSVTNGSIAEDTLASTTTNANLSGTLVGADIDNDKVLTYGILTGNVTAGVSTLAGSYGTLTVNTTTGAYNYAKDAAAAEVLHVGESVSDLFTVIVTDNHGAQAIQNYTINVTGANDAPILAAVTSGSIAEDALASTTTNANLSGTLAGADIDNDKVLTYGISTGSVTAGVSTLAGSYGTLTVDTITGAFSYAKDVAAVEALHVGESVSDLFTVTVTDNHGVQATRSCTINLTGANDTPVITNLPAAATGSVTEAGHLDNGQAVPNGMGVDGLTYVTGTLSATDIDNNATRSWSVSDQTPETSYGTMTINASGKWDYALNNYLPSTQALREGEVVTEAFTARVTDDKGAYADQTVTVTIIGTNDVPVVANDASALDGVVTEAGNLDNGTIVSGTSTASATLSASDVDMSASQVWSLVGKPGSTYGVMSIDPATGKWSYTLDNTLAATQALGEGDVDTQTYTARVTDDKDAYVNQTITITINGSNDSPVAVADTNTTAENVILTVTAANGLLANDTDPDTGATHTVNAVASITGNVGAAVTGTNGGTFTIAADGSYSFNPGSTTFDYLAVGETTTSSVNDTVLDDKGAASSSSVTVTITGTNDAPVVASTDVSGAISEAIGIPAALATLTESGTIAFSDVDLADAHTPECGNGINRIIGYVDGDEEPRYNRHGNGWRDHLELQCWLKCG
jgi:VCBS repeat-containing protein